MSNLSVSDLNFLARLHNPKSGQEVDAFVEYSWIDTGRPDPPVFGIRTYLFNPSRRRVIRQDDRKFFENQISLGTSFLEASDDLGAWMLHIRGVARRNTGLGLMLLCSSPLAVAYISASSDGYIFSYEGQTSDSLQILFNKAIRSGLARYDLTDYDPEDYTDDVSPIMPMPGAKRVITARSVVLSGHVVDLCPKLMEMFRPDILS